MATAAGTVKFDKASYSKGDKITVTVVDPSRVNPAVTVTVPSAAGPLTATVAITTPQGQISDSGSRTWSLVSDDPSTGTTVWSATA